MCQACFAEFATKSDGYTPMFAIATRTRQLTGVAVELVPSLARLERMQADGVLEYIVDHAVGVDVTASSLA